MLEVLQFVFSSFWVWLGFAMFLCIVCAFIAMTVAVLFSLSDAGRGR